MKVRFSPRAFADRERIFDDLSQQSPAGARNVLASLRDSIATLGDQPRSGHLTNDPSVRVKFVVRYPYKVFYRVRDETVEILHIRHTARRPLRAIE